VNNEIIIGEKYTSILKTDTNMYRVGRNEEHVVEHKPVVRNRTIKTSDFFANLKEGFTNQNEILPTGCKHFQTFNGGYKILVIEEPPRVRTLKADIGMEATIEKLRLTGKLEEYGYENYLAENNGNPYSFQLSFPYVVFIIMLNRSNELVTIKPFFRLQPITSLADYLFIAPLYNVPTSQDICLGGVENFGTIFETTENIIETFWLNRYNADYTDNIKVYQKSEAYEVHDYLSWMYFTKFNPMFIYNVKWIKYDFNIGKILNSLKMNYDNYTNSNVSYNLLHKSALNGNSETLNPETNAKNACFSTIINKEQLSVGDEIIFDNKSYYLYSIVTKDNGHSFDSVELEDHDGTLINVPFAEFEQDLNESYKPNFLEEAEVNGNIIKPDSIISCKIGDYTVYKKIKSIRKALDGKIEVMVGTDHYLIENIDFDIIDTSNVKLNGEPLDKDKTYLMLKVYESYSPVYGLIKVKFHDMIINTSGSFIIKFKDLERENFINLNINEYEKGESNYNFVEEDEVKDFDVIYQFDKLLTNENVSENQKFRVIPGKGILMTSNYGMRDYSPNNNVEDIVEKILIEDGTRLHIPGSMIDIDFKVGDPIVYANWSNPDDMLKISSIEKFEYDKEEETLYICANTLNKEEQFRIPYVDFKNYRVRVGVIRKVVSKYGDWNSGDKIKANSTGITNFPKKDVNTIIAFIADGATKYPLALCSNLCTLWMNEDTISKFNVFPRNSIKWKKLEHTPYDVIKIKWQHGDNFITNSVTRRNTYLNFLSKRSGTKYSFEYNYSMNHGVLDWGTNITKNSLDNYYIRHGIIMPRIPITNYGAASTKRGFPNLLGGFIINSNSRIVLRSEQFKEDF